MAKAPAGPVNVATLGMKVGRPKVNMATGGEPPLVPVPPPPPPLPAEDVVLKREVASCLDVLRSRLDADPILRAEMAPFEGAQWDLVGRFVIRAEAAGRWAKVTTAGEAPQVELGSLAWAGSKRIPL